MEKDLRNIPDWKIPPAEEVCRRGSGQFTQRIVGNRCPITVKMYCVRLNI